MRKLINFTSAFSSFFSVAAADAQPEERRKSFEHKNMKLFLMPAVDEEVRFDSTQVINLKISSLGTYVLGPVRKLAMVNFHCEYIITIKKALVDHLKFCWEKVFNCI